MSDTEHESISIPKYDGTTDVERWILMVKNISKTKKWDDSITLSHALIKLTGEALKWAENSGAASADTWNKLHLQLRLRFKITLDDAAVRSEMSRVKRKKEESIFTYSDRLLAVSVKAAERLSEHTMCQYLIKGVAKEYQFSLYMYVKNHKDCTFTELVRMMHEYEALGLGSSSEYQASSSTSPVPDPSHVSSTPAVKCSYCGALNHSEQDCRKRKNDERVERERLDAEKNVLPNKLRSEVTPSSSSSSSYKHSTVCDYCQRSGHTYESCYKRMADEYKKSEKDSPTSLSQ